MFAFKNVPESRMVMEDLNSMLSFLQGAKQDCFLKPFIRLLKSPCLDLDQVCQLRNYIYDSDSKFSDGEITKVKKINQGSYRQDCVKFKDFSRTS